MSVADMSSELPGLGVSGRLYRHVGDKLAYLETGPGSNRALLAWLANQPVT